MTQDHDADPEETRDWLDSLHSVLEKEGIERAHFLIERLVAEMRRSGAHLPYKATTAYLNTIRKSEEEQSPGEPGLEHRIRSINRWNAIAMVHRANTLSSELGGHIYIVEFGEPEPNRAGLDDFAATLDAALCRSNADYRGHRLGGFGLAAPVVVAAPPGTFAAWMKGRGQLGGQHKVPRIINDVDLFQSLRTRADAPPLH